MSLEALLRSTSGEKKLEGFEGGRSEGRVFELVLLEIRERYFAISVENVVSILPPLRITQVPWVPEYILGIVNSAGRVIAVLDLARYAGFEAESEPKRLVVIASGPLEAAIPVLSVETIGRIGDEGIQPPLVGESLPYVTGQIFHRACVFSVVDAARLLESSAHRPGQR